MSSQRGTTLIFALVILAVAAMVLAGSIVLVSAMLENTLAAKTASTRRQTLENSRMLAVQFVREKLLTSGLSAGVTNMAVSGGGYSLGGLTFGGTSAWTSTNRPAYPNVFSPAGATAVSGGYYYSGFTAIISGTLSDGTMNVPWNVEARSRTPTLGYDLASYVSSGTALSVSSAASVGTTNGPVFGGVLLNSAFPPEIATTGYVSSATTGATTITIASGTLTNSEYLRVGGTVTMFLNGADASRTYVISGSLTNLNFNYSGTYSTVPGYPLRVICLNLTGSSAVNFDAGSIRPVYLVYSGSRPVTINHTSTPRLTALFDGVTATFASGSIQGGFRANVTPGVSGGTLNLVRETNVGTLDNEAIRRGWVESYRND